MGKRSASPSSRIRCTGLFRGLLQGAPLQNTDNRIISQRGRHGTLPSQSKEDTAQDKHQEEETAPDTSQGPSGDNITEARCGQQAGLTVSISVYIMSIPPQVMHRMQWMLTF